MADPDRAWPAGGRLKIFFDGGWRPGIGEMETAVVARGTLHHRPLLGPGSSERAEWLALLDGLRVARSLGAADVQLLGDSVSVINQANGIARCSGHRACLEAFRDELAAFGRVRLTHVPRAQNLAGIALARMRDGAAGPVQGQGSCPASRGSRVERSLPPRE